MLQLDDRRFNRLAVAAVSIGFALLIIAFGAGIIALIYAQRSNEQVDHTYHAVEQLAEVDVWVERAETASRGYLLVPDPLRAQTFRENVNKIAPAVDRLAQLIEDNPAQRRNIAILRRQIGGEVAALESIMAKASAGDQAAGRDEFRGEVGKRRVNQIRATTQVMRGVEGALLAERSATEARTSAVTKFVLSLTGILLLLIGGSAVWLVRRYTVDLSRARDRLHLLNTDLEGAVQVRTADLVRANDEIQRFAYIVSHDLRSPLVNIMGFTAELDSANRDLGKLIETVEQEQPALITPAARAAALEDLPEAIGFIRSSAQKMDRLINAILNLSRLGRRMLTPEHLPMARIIGEIADSLTTLAEEREATIIVDPDLPDLIHDRLAVEQIFSNLIENATKYLKPGQPGRIEIKGVRRGARVSYDITDNGRGIAPNDHERIFELFRRSGGQDQQGEGIGLAHVRALAYRLGGTVKVRSSLGEGSTFIVDLPTAYSEGEKDQ